MRPCHFPAIGSFNMNHLGVSDEALRQEKLQKVRLVQASHHIVGLQELHAKTELRAYLFFFKFLDGITYYETSTYHLAIQVDKKWHEEHRDSGGPREI